MKLKKIAILGLSVFAVSLLAGCKYNAFEQDAINTYS